MAPLDVAGKKANARRDGPQVSTVSVRDGQASEGQLTAFSIWKYNRMPCHRFCGAYPTLPFQEVRRAPTLERPTSFAIQAQRAMQMLQARFQKGVSGRNE